MHVVRLPEFSRLSTPEKILLIEDLWDSIAGDDRRIPVPESHKAELDRRLARQVESPGPLLTLDELLTRVEKRRR